MFSKNLVLISSLILLWSLCLSQGLSNPGKEKVLNSSIPGISTFANGKNAWTFSDLPKDLIWSKNVKVGHLEKQYIGFEITMNFMSFLEFCHMFQWQPAAVNSAEENNALVQYLSNNFPDPIYFWLGGMDVGREASYYWITTLEEFNYTSWGPGYPNGGREENCATIYGGDGTWYDQYCDNEGIWPICENTVPAP